ncbi:GNAT family N-acetyltransferase [Chloroflexi bacterium TSY]|nr:GNAT family N-acetyltransferase [Chloroflexi bacterium TSY]
MKIFHHPPEFRSRELLAECDLPTSDLESRHFDHFLGCGPAEDPQGIVGLEIFGAVALLRSLAVAKDARGTGCGKALVMGAETYAKEKGVSKLYLLTTTAERFFVHLGYSHAERSSAPEQLKRTKEFSDLCPENAAFMMKKLAG